MVYKKYKCYYILSCQRFQMEKKYMVFFLQLSKSNTKDTFFTWYRISFNSGRNIYMLGGRKLVMPEYIISTTHRLWQIVWGIITFNLTETNLDFYLTSSYPKWLIRVRHIKIRLCVLSVERLGSSPILVGFMLLIFSVLSLSSSLVLCA